MGEQPSSPKYWRGCSGKIRHVSKKKASAAMRLMVKHGKDVSANLEAYKCSMCHGWHTGRNKRRAA